VTAVEEEAFHRLLNSLMAIGREDPQFRFDVGGCQLSRSKARKAILDEASALSARNVADFAKRPCVPLAIDAGTVERRHSLLRQVPAQGQGDRSNSIPGTVSLSRLC
jgi:hypothetical protein